MKKEELRKEYLKKRMALSEAELVAYNQKITDQFFSLLDSSRIHVIHLFLPIERKKEIDTWQIVNRLKSEFGLIQISIPKVNESGDLENYFFEGLNQLQFNGWGIAEPKQGIPTPTEKIDMVLVPLLAVDETGHRVGYGKGFYDRFLKACRPDCEKVGLSFFEPITHIDDVTEEDVKLDAVITPEKLYHF